MFWVKFQWLKGLNLGVYVTGKWILDIWKIDWNITKNCIIPKSLSEEAIEVFSNRSPIRIVKLFSNVNFYIQQLWELIIPLKSIFTNKTWDWGFRKRWLKKPQDLPEKFQNSFSSISKMDQWLLVRHGNKRAFFLQNVFFLHKTCLLL